MFSDLKNRLISSSFLIVASSVLIYFSIHPVIQFIVMVSIALLTVAALYEYVSILRTKEIQLPFWLLATWGVIFVFVNYLSTIHVGLSFMIQMVVVAFFFAIFLFHFSKVEGAIIKISTCFFGAIYIVVPLGLLLRILYPESISVQFTDGRLWLTFLVAVTKGTDMGAYFIGNMWGKSKLAPHLSPGKTLNGAIGGFFFAIAVSLVFYGISYFTSPSIFYLTLLQSLVLGGLLGIFGQLGDLAESLLKRDARVKDSNHLPGVGGVLDLLDSLLFTTPILYLFLKAYSL